MALSVTLTGPTRVECGLPATFHVTVAHTDPEEGTYEICFTTPGGACSILGEPDCFQRSGAGLRRWSRNLTLTCPTSPQPSTELVQVVVTHLSCGQVGTATKSVQCEC